MGRDDGHATQASGHVGPCAKLRGAPGGTRTPSLLIRSQPLYPLSYGGRTRAMQGRLARGQPPMPPVSGTSELYGFTQECQRCGGVNCTLIPNQTRETWEVTYAVRRVPGTARLATPSRTSARHRSSGGRTHEAGAAGGTLGARLTLVVRSGQMGGRALDYRRGVLPGAGGAVAPLRPARMERSPTRVTSQSAQASTPSPVRHESGKVTRSGLSASTPSRK